MKKSDLLVGALVVVLVGFGCKQSGSQAPNNSKTGSQIIEQPSFDRDTIFSNANTKVSFQYKSYLQPDASSIQPGSVTLSFKQKPNASGLIDTLYFSTKTRDAWLAEKQKLDPKKPCESYALPGCERWDDDVALYDKVISTNNFGDYYALGFDTVTLGGIKFVIVVTYNPDRQQYQTTYLAYADNTRITFVDPATGGLEYGVPFQMNAKNRELVESTGMHLAKREKIDDVKTRARADELFQIVSTVQLAK